MTDFTASHDCALNNNNGKSGFDARTMQLESGSVQIYKSLTTATFCSTHRFTSILWWGEQNTPCDNNTQQVFTIRQIKLQTQIIKTAENLKLMFLM